MACGFLELFQSDKDIVRWLAARIISWYGTEVRRLERKEQGSSRGISRACLSDGEEDNGQRLGRM